MVGQSQWLNYLPRYDRLTGDTVSYLLASCLTGMSLTLCKLRFNFHAVQEARFNPETNISFHEHIERTGTAEFLFRWNRYAVFAPSCPWIN